MASLLESVKAALRVTWDTEDDSIKETIAEGQAVLNSICGTLPYEGEKDLSRLAVSLLKDYCRYARDGSAAYFTTDYKDALLRLQLKAATEGME